MFQKVEQAAFLAGEHSVLNFWREQDIFKKLQAKNAGNKKWSFLDGPITANNPMGVHHAWGRTFKDAYQRYFAMTGHELRYQNGFDCQGLWVEVEVEKELNLGTKKAIEELGIEHFTRACKQRVLKFAARQTEQSQRLGYWMEWDSPEELRKLSENIGTDNEVTLQTPKGTTATGTAEELTAQLGNPEWGGSYFTFSTENNETIWSFLKKCHERGKVYLGHDVMPWGGRAGSAYSQMEIADGRKLTTHRSVFARFPLVENTGDAEVRRSAEGLPEYLLIWTTTPWTLTSNVATMINTELEYVRCKVQLRGDEEPCILYFAKENLKFQRLAKEYKEGFGTDMPWPKDVPKLKTLAQIFKEQGGFEELGTVTGEDMVGWNYRGPFDELEAQNSPEGFVAVENDMHFGGGEALGAGTGTGSGYGSREAMFEASSAGQHQVVDAGRDFKGHPIVVAGEGTGIVHSAPGCGDVDHKIGMELGLPVIAPLRQNGTFGNGFGTFNGKEAIDPETAEMVFESLKEKGLLVYVETYPHIYPHCWRTGEELIFRLVDEWFINMDWRDEIKEVTKAINWIPESIQGQQREIEWLDTMRDWMISKKRYWGLALPIWVNPDDPTDYDVIGSLAELEERAKNGGEGWDEFEGHTPHRPYIDVVKIKSKKTGALLERIEDVGNPWLDAGIVPFSTMNYNGRYPEEALKWSDWFPADMITECFPGQFRNWFYSLLSLATMMGYEEGEDRSGEEKRPFKNLLGHRLVMDEDGNAMHKSDGTAIWFEEAAEQLGVDTIRWMYLAQNPASDLRFGRRHKDEPVTLETPEGPIAETQEGLPTCKVTSTPADEIRRQVLIPLWNSYAFFVNYAVLDGFDPSAEQVPVSDRPEIDRWILSRLQELTAVAHESFQSFHAADFMKAATDYIDDLSNWYIRRNRRRFWKPVQDGDANTWDADKLAAYQTMYEVLVTLSKLLAPAIPFLSERIYENLVKSVDKNAAESVHLCDYPAVDESKLDANLNWSTQQVQTLVQMGHRLREASELRVRQPLAELRFACANDDQATALEQSQAIIADELNVKQVTREENLDALVNYAFKPNLKTLGPKYGKLLGTIRKELPEYDAAALAPLRNSESVTITLGGEDVTLGPDDVLVSVEAASDWASADADGIQVALATELTSELIDEGMARDLIRHIQQARKDADLEENQRITVTWSTENDADESRITSMVQTWQETIQSETRADGLEPNPSVKGASVNVGDVATTIEIST